MARQGDVHVVFRADAKKWAVEVTGRERAAKVTTAKSEAEQAGRDLAKRTGAELLVHGKDGKIQRRDSHGRDPSSSRG